jgi:two-component system sensor histidine kinase AlgZ
MLPVLMQRSLQKSSVAKQTASGASAGADASVAKHSYFPDFAASGNILILLVIAQTVAFMLSLVQAWPGPGFFQCLSETSVLVLLLAVSSAWLLTTARPLLSRLSVASSSALALAIVLANTTIVSDALYWFGNVYGDPLLSGPASMFPQDRWAFLSRNLLITAVVGLVVMRYFYVTDQWRRNVETAAESRINALQARIRPHFLFNSMNTIAALTRTNPAAAENAIEDLADLFRASLGDPGQPVSLEQELDTARIYQRMEQQRLGERLVVDWQLKGLPLQTRVPALIIQPLLENAIYHGIEPLVDGGVITVVGVLESGVVTLTVSNPLAPEGQRHDRNGHQIALDNIRQRLELAYGNRARFEVEQSAGQFRVLIGFPAEA